MRLSRRVSCDGFHCPEAHYRLYHQKSFLSGESPGGRILRRNNQLARDITYGNRGRPKGNTLEEITSSGNCTTLIMAAIIYWQAKEISRIVRECDPETAGIDLSLLAHISPIGWYNVILWRVQAEPGANQTLNPLGTCTQKSGRYPW